MSNVSRLGATLVVNYPDSDISGMAARTPDRVTIKEEVGRHTLMIIDHDGRPEHFKRTLLTGSPVEVATSSRAGQRSWFGYVTSIEPSVTGRGRTTVTALGVTYHMKKTSNRVWGPQPLAKTMNELIYLQGLTPFVEDTGLIQEVPQAGRTDFELLVDLATTCGLTVFTTGTTVNCLSPAATMRYFHDEAARIQKVRRYDVPQALDSMTTMVETSDQMAQSRVAASLVDPVTARTYTSTSGAGVFVDQGARIVSRNPQALQTQTKAASDMSKFPFRMRAEGQGVTVCTAGKPVYASNLGDENWWLTEKVEHVFIPPASKHTMIIDLRRTGDTYSYAKPAPAAQRGFDRSLPNFCFCLEHKPVLVGPTQGTYITNMMSTQGTDTADFGWPDVDQWAVESPVTAPPQQFQPFGAWTSMRRWRARGKCLQ